MPLSLLKAFSPSFTTRLHIRFWKGCTGISLALPFLAEYTKLIRYHVGNEYSIENVGTETARILYYQGNEVVIDGVEERKYLKAEVKLLKSKLKVLGKENSVLHDCLRRNSGLDMEAI